MSPQSKYWGTCPHVPYGPLLVIQGKEKKTGPLCFAACNFGSIDHIGSIFQITVTLTSACRLSAEDHALQCAEQTTVKCPSSTFQFSTVFFVDVQSTFVTADELLYKFDFFPRNFDVLNDRGRLLPFGRSVTPIKLIFFSSRSTLVRAQFFPENFLNKRCELQFFSWRKTLISARSSFVMFFALNKKHFTK